METPERSPADALIADVDSDISGIVDWIKHHAKLHATPYHLAVAAVLGGITTVFAVVIGLLIIVALNFNVLSLIE